MINLFLISKYRTVLMGLATIMILMCHANVYGVSVPIPIKKALIYGNYGVDIFLFLSAIGCHRSLKKGGAFCLKNWYTKRFYRIWIPYTLVHIPFWLLLIFWGQFNFMNEIYKYSTIQYWTEHKGAWYIALIIPLYLCTPFIFKLFEKSRHRLVLLCILLLLLIALCNIDFSFITIEKYPTMIDNCQWAIFRCMSFFIGMYMAPFIELKKSVNFYLISGSFLILYLIIHIIFPEFFMGWALVVPICIIFVLIIENAKSRWLTGLFTFLGGISLESYLTNINLNPIMNEIIIKYKIEGTIFTGHYLEYALVIIIGLTLSYLINTSVKKILSPV